MKKVIGYVAIILGFVLVVSSRISSLFEKLGFLPKIVLDSVLYIGLACFVFGVVVFLMMKGAPSSRSGGEVPIYRGNQIVGYRRH